jgi:hypothetical protein
MEYTGQLELGRKINSAGHLYRQRIHDFCPHNVLGLTSTIVFRGQLTLRFECHIQMFMPTKQVQGLYGRVRYHLTSQPVARVYAILIFSARGLEMSCWYSVNWTFRCQHQRLCEESEVTKVLRPDGHYEMSDFWPLVLQRV